MTPDMRTKLRYLLIKDEGYRLLPYVDTIGHITIGVGRNLSSRGVYPSEIDQMLQNDMNYFYEHLCADFNWFNNLSEVRQIALIDMCFNVGLKTFHEFEMMIWYLARRDFINAAKEMLNSKWATQVGNRAERLAKIIETGEWIFAQEAA